MEFLWLWNSISQNQFTKEGQITSHDSNASHVFRKKDFYKKPTYRTGDIHMYEPCSVAAGNLHLSQNVSFWAELSQASSCRLPGHWHAASSLSESSRSRHIPATSELKLGNMQAELPPPTSFLSLPRNKKTRAWSITHEPSFIPGSFHKTSSMIFLRWN